MENKVAYERVFIVVPDGEKEKQIERMKNWPYPQCEIPVLTASEAVAKMEEEK